jgi:hypothetical protein
MFIGDLFESEGKQVKVIYPGRFQPPHKGHAQVYTHLCQKFGVDNVYIVTSDKVAMPKSPFNFAEKAKMWALTGVNTDRVLMDPQPYRATEVVAQWDPANTILLFAVSEKDMAEDPRFSFKPKKDGSPSYFQQFTDLKQCQSLDKHAYMMTVPTFNFTVLGQPANSASQIREQFAGADLATQRKIVTDLFGKFDNNVFNIMKARLEVGEVTEDDDSDIVDNLVTTTGRTHEEAQRILRAARRRALQMSKKVGSNMSEPAWGNTMAQQIAAAPRGKEVFMKGESAGSIGKKFGVRYKVFAGREGRLTTKEAWAVSQEALEKLCARIEALDGFYEFDGFSYPHGEEQGVVEDQKSSGLTLPQYAVMRTDINGDVDMESSHPTIEKARTALRYLQKNLSDYGSKYHIMQAGYGPGDKLPEDRATPNKPPKKGSQRWLTAQKSKEYEKRHPPVEPADQMYGTAKILPKKTEEGRLPQLPTTGADYSKFDTEHLKSMLRPGVMHRNELKFKTLIRRELRKRQKAEQVTELHPDTHASHIEKRGPMVIPTLMKDVKKGAKMGRAVSKSMEKVKAFNKKSDEPNVFEETNSAEMARLQRELRKATDPNKKEAIKLSIRKLKGEMELRAKDKRINNFIDSGAGYTGGSQDDRNKRFNKFVGEDGVRYNPQDTVTFDIPLLIRMLEFAREDAKTDMDLHNVTEKMIQLSADGKTLSMAQYNSIVSPKVQESINRQLDKRLEEGWGRKTAAGLAAAAAIGVGGCTPAGETSRACQNIEKKMQGTKMQRAGVMANPTTRNMAAGCNIKKKLTKETIVPGFGEMRPEQVKKEVEGLTAEMLQYARDGNMRAVAEYIKKLQPFVDTARKGEITESIDKALRTVKRNAI